MILMWLRVTQGLVRSHSHTTFIWAGARGEGMYLLLVANYIIIL